MPRPCERLHYGFSQQQDAFSVNHPEIIKLQKFLQLKFNNKNIDVRPRHKLNDSVEVFIGDESIGLIHLDDEDGDKSYIFNMSILDIDLDDVE